VFVFCHRIFGFKGIEKGKMQVGVSFFFHPQLCKILLQNAVTETPGGSVRFQQVAGGYFIQEMYGAQRLPDWQSFHPDVPVCNRHHRPDGQGFLQFFEVSHHYLPKQCGRHCIGAKGDDGG
jgi:hypothetical protein